MWLTSQMIAVQLGFIRRTAGVHNQLEYSGSVTQEIYIVEDCEQSLMFSSKSLGWHAREASRDEAKSLTDLREKVDGKQSIYIVLHWFLRHSCTQYISQSDITN